jgi:ketosteroid isomerase-like protein
VHKYVLMLSLVFVLGATSYCAAEPAEEATAETQSDAALIDPTLAVEIATRQFYAALNSMFGGDASSMDQIWSHSDKVTYMGPGGGIATGWDEVQAIWQQQAGLKLGGHVEPGELHVTVGQDVALVECYEQGINLGANGGALPVRIRATNSFRQENGQWKMIGHHTDLLPFLSGAEVETAGASTANLSDPGDPADTDSIEVSGDDVLLKLED